MAMWTRLRPGALVPAALSATLVASAADEPAVVAFVLPRRSPELRFPVNSFKAADNVMGYAITATPIPPAPSAAVWCTTPPKEITEDEPGVYDYYGWVKDADGRVSLYAEQTVDVKTTTITVGPKGRDFTNFADAIAAIAEKGNPKGIVIEADAGEYPSWRAENEYKGKKPYLKNIIKVRSDNLTIRGVGGRAHLAYKCRGAVSKNRWTVPPHGPQHGSIIVQAAKNLRLENVEISGGCEANSGNGAGLWVEPAGVGTVLRNCYLHHNDNGILTSRIAGARVVIMNSEFYMNGSPGPFAEGQNHNIYVGEVDEFVFMFNYSHASYRGQLLKSRAGRNYLLYNRLTDETDSNYEIDLPYGGESYVVGNLIQQSTTARNATIINYGREMVMTIVYKNGGPERLKDKASITNARTGKTYRIRYNFNYGARGKWENRDRANYCTANMKEADQPDFQAGDTLTYGKNSSIEVVRAAWKWTSPKRELYVVNNTIVNEHARGYGQYLIRAHIDTHVVEARNNLIIDLHPKAAKFGVRIDASKQIGEKPVTESGNVWLTADPGLVDIGHGDYRLTASAVGVVDKGGPANRVNGMDRAPMYEYVHPCAGRKRPVDGKIDVGAYEYRPASSGMRKGRQ